MTKAETGFKISAATKPSPVRSMSTPGAGGPFQHAARLTSIAPSWVELNHSAIVKSPVPKLPTAAGIETYWASPSMLKA